MRKQVPRLEIYAYIYTLADDSPKHAETVVVVFAEPTDTNIFLRIVAKPYNNEPVPIVEVLTIVEAALHTAELRWTRLNT